jgi:tetratricopeptide (TPR) repeat protein
MSSQSPANAEELIRVLQQGLALHQSGRLAEAADVYALILQGYPDQPETLDLYGVLLHQTGNDAQAWELLNRAVTLRSDSAAFRNHFGAVQRALGDFDGAVSSFETACRLEPSLHEAAHNLAASLAQLERYEEALEAARAAIGLAPDNPEYRLVMAQCCRQLDLDEQAVGTLRHAIAVTGPETRLQISLARSLVKTGEEEEARREVKRAILVQPESADGYGLLAASGGGIETARQSVIVSPADGLAWSQYASKLCQAYEDADAISEAGKAIALRPDLLAGYLIYCDSANRKYLFQRAFDAAKRGLLIGPKSHHLAVSAGFGELLLGDVARGWELYKRRRFLPEELPRLGLPPEWSDAEPRDGPLLVCSEQGLGDEYLFLSCLPDLLGIKSSVIVECDPRNLDLFSRSFPEVRFFPRTVSQQDGGSPVWDYHEIVETLRPTHHVLAGDLMGRFQVGMGRTPPGDGYIDADPEERRLWSEWLASLGGKPKVGLSWRSGDPDAVRSEFYFDLETVVDALGVDQASYVSIVYIDASAEIEALAASRNIEVFDPPDLDQRNELGRVAALISSLDLVVSVDNAVGAIAASCGVPTILLERGMFQISGDGDALFGNVHPCLSGAETFNRSKALAKAGATLKNLLAA